MKPKEEALLIPVQDSPHVTEGLLGPSLEVCDVHVCVHRDTRDGGGDADAIQSGQLFLGVRTRGVLERERGIRPGPGLASSIQQQSPENSIMVLPTRSRSPGFCSLWGPPPSLCH